MELKVWVEGIQRIVCGVTESTTCQDVVYALAHATGKTGRFTLIERWRNNERLLTPQEHPLKVVSKWGEYSSEVQLILMRSGGWGAPSSPPHPLILSSNQQEVNVKKDTTNDNTQSFNGNNLHLKQESRSMGNILKQDEKEEAVVYNSRYRDLLRLVNLQRDKLSAQQAELTKYDAEIVFWENKNREQRHQMEFVMQETSRYEVTASNNEIKLRTFGNIEEEKDLILQQERTLKSELTLLRSKLANCETELLQCKNKIRLLSEELALEERQKEEVAMLKEVERLQTEIEVVRHNSDSTVQSTESFRKQVEAIEAAIIEKKKLLEKLIAEIKEANLQSLSISPAEEVKLLFEGPCKPGSARRMIGSPRQLENAVPTSKNPHGVWV